MYLCIIPLNLCQSYLFPDNCYWLRRMEGSKYFPFLFFTNLSVSTWCNQHQLTRKLPSLLVVLFLKKQISDNYWKTPAAIEHEKTNKQSTFSYIFSHLPAILHIHRQKPSLNNNIVLCILSCCTTLLTDIQRKTQMEYWSIKVTLP